MTKQKIVKVATALIIISMSTAGCSTYFVQDVVEAVAHSEKIETFYGKGVQAEYVGDELVQSIDFTEWKGHNGNYRTDTVNRIQKDYYKEVFNTQVDDTKVQEDTIRLETQYIYNDKEVVIYYPESNECIIRNVNLEDNVQESMMQGVNSLIVNGSAREYTMSLISELNHRYDVTIEDDIKLNDRYTQHLIAVAREKGDDAERKEYWIDQQNWLIVKMVEYQGNYKMEFGYTEYQINSHISEEHFNTDFKENTKVEYIGPNLELEKEELTLEEAKNKFNRPIYYIQENEKIKSESIKYIQTMTRPNGIIELVYTVNGTKKVIIENERTYQIDENLDLGYERININGQEARYHEIDGQKYVQLTASETTCNIYVKNSEITKEELIDIASQVVLLD